MAVFCRRFQKVRCVGNGASYMVVGVGWPMRQAGGGQLTVADTVATTCLDGLVWVSRGQAR